MPELEVVAEHPDGSTDTFPATASEEMYEFEKIDVCSIYVARPLLGDVTLREDRDEISLVEDGVERFAGILRDVDRGGAEAELLVESYERLALDAQPTEGGEIYDPAPDDEIVLDAIEATPDLEPGTVEQLDEETTFVFSHASRAKQMREVAQATGGELFFHPDKTVDYVEELGEDRTDTTISPQNQNIVEDFEVRRKGGNDRVTHLRMLGAGEGEHQVRATVVADDYEAGDRQSWETRINKDITDADVLESHGRVLLAELNEAQIDVETTVKDVDVGLGDRFHVYHPREDVDQGLRAVEVTRRVDAQGVSYDVVLSNRRLTRQTEDERIVEDTDRYNLAFEGSPVTINTGGGRQPVSDAVNYEFSVYYPSEVQYEHRVKLQVAGRAYRAYSQGAAAGGGSHSHSVTIPSHTHDFEIGVYDLPDHHHRLNILSGTTETVDSHEHSYDYSGETLQNTDGSLFHGTGGVEVVTESVQQSTTENGGGTTTTSSSTTPSHTHAPEPGLVRFNEYPSNCDVLVNGESAGVSLGDGSGAFEETVDLQGMLIPGRWNRIEVSSGSIGHIQAHLDVDVYRQILGRG